MAVRVNKLRLVAEPTSFVVLQAGILAAAVLLLLKLPAGLREVAFLGTVYVAFLLGISSFTQVWTLILLVMPFVVLVTNLFGEPKFFGVRFLLLCMALALMLRGMKRGSFGVRLKSGFVLTFLLFILANFISALRTFEVESIFRSLTYLEPLLFFVFTYYTVRENPSNIKPVLKALVIGGLLVAVLGGVEFLQQRPILDTLGINTTDTLSLTFAQDRFGLRRTCAVGHWTTGLRGHVFCNLADFIGSLYPALCSKI